MAVDEACQNIIRHAYSGHRAGDIVLEIERQADRLVFWLRDFAPRVDVSKVKPRKLDTVRPGGLGLHLIRQVMDESGFVACPSDDGNIFRMAKRIS
jgi:sigma-B regulation protein RsbU (phosphoserine phosphatase)